MMEKSETVVYMELGNNLTVHTQLKCTGEFRARKHRFTLCCSQHHALFFPPTISLFNCKTMFTTNFSFAMCVFVCMYNRFYLV